MAVADPSRGDWQCPNDQCYNHINYPNAYVYGSSLNCKKCGTGKAAQKPGDWCCPNPQCINNKNCVYGSKSTCPKCGCPKPTVMNGGMNGGKGGGMGGMGGMGMRMPNFAMPQAMPASGVAPPRDGDWHCPNAGCKNHTGNVVYGSKSSCPLCGTAKPDMPVMAAATPRQFMANMYQQSPAMVKGGRPGDWHCSNANCKNHIHNVVYGSKDVCPLCNSPKPSTPVSSAASQYGGYQFGGQQFGGAAPRHIPNQRPGDWHCNNPNCKNHEANIIYASKTECPLCGASKDDERMQSRSPRRL